jgi:putative transcriptional regulator
MRTAREAAGFTQGQLASRLGIAQRTACNWERGQSVPHPRYIVPLAAALEVDFADLAVQIALFFSSR